VTEDPVVVLVRPQLAENIGAAARAARCGGLTALRLVAPRPGSWPSDAATAMAAGALDGLAVGVFATLPEAVADCRAVYAFTARRRDLAKPFMAPREAVAAVQHRAAFVFGAEREGLTNEEVARATALVHIPTSGDFTSLNLAQAVMVAAYEWAAAAFPPLAEGGARGGPHPAQQSDLEGFFARLEAELERAHFFRSPEMRPAMMRNIRACLARAAPSAQEVRTWHGIVTALTGGKAPL